MECQHELAIRKVSVRPSVKRVNCDKTDEKSVQIFSFLRRRMVGGGDPFYPKFWVNHPVGAKLTILNQ